MKNSLDLFLTLRPFNQLLEDQTLVILEETQNQRIHTLFLGKSIL